MLMEAKNQFRVSMLSIKYNIIREMINPVSFITNILFMILNNATFIVQWIILFSLKDNIAGYGLKEVLEIWAIAASGYGIWHIFFYSSTKLSRLILTGGLDTFIVQPKNVLLSVLTSSTSISAIGDLIYGIVLFSILSFNLYSILLFILLTIMSGIILTSVSVVFGSLTFFLGNTSILSEQINNIVTIVSTYPVGIFKKTLQLILFTVLPIGIMVHLPVQVINNFNIYAFLIIFVFTLLIVALAFLIFNLGLKRYSSSNLMNARI